MQISFLNARGVTLRPCQSTTDTLTSQNERRKTNNVLLSFSSSSGARWLMQWCQHCDCFLFNFTTTTQLKLCHSNEVDQLLWQIKKKKDSTLDGLCGRSDDAIKNSWCRFILNSQGLKGETATVGWQSQSWTIMYVGPRSSQNKSPDLLLHSILNLWLLDCRSVLKMLHQDTVL